jgi:hypothetical protein
MHLAIPSPWSILSLRFHQRKVARDILRTPASHPYHLLLSKSRHQIKFPIHDIGKRPLSSGRKNASVSCEGNGVTHTTLHLRSGRSDERKEGRKWKEGRTWKD